MPPNPRAATRTDDDGILAREVLRAGSILGLAWALVLLIQRLP